MLDLGTLRLRPFVLADAGAVEPWLVGPGLSLPAGRARQDWPQRLLADARIRAHIAERGARQVGFVRLDCGPDRIAEVTLVVAPECRRQGLGRKMFRAALQEARRLGLWRLVAIVDAGNQPALEFFAEVGFTRDGMLGDRVRLVRIVHAGGRPMEIVL